MVFYSSDGSDRGKRTENIASIGLCCVAIAGFLCLVWALGSLSGKQAEQRRSQPHLHAMAAKDEALARCASKSAGMLTECLYDAIEASEATSRTEQDLTAQQRAAWAAAFAAFFAFISLPISIGGLWALLRSLKHTEQAIAVSVNAIDETRKANIQARKQAKAVLYTTDCYFDFMHDQSAQHMDCRVILNVENVGDTPAQRVVFKVGVHFLNKRKRLAVGSKNHFIGIVRARSNENAEMKFTIKDRAVLDQNIKKFNRVLITLERTFMDVFDDRSEEKYALISPVSKREDGLFAANDFTFCDRNFVSVIKNVPLRRAS